MSRGLQISCLALFVAGAAWLIILRMEAAPDRIATDLVVDEAQLMSPAQRASITEFHRYLLEDFDIDYRIVTANGTEDINQDALRRFEALAGRSRSGTGRALLLVVDPKMDLVRLEVSYALEGAFPDAFVAYVEQRQMVPFFRRNRVADGILATTELIIARAQRAVADAGFEGEAWISGSGGAGATTKAHIGAGVKPVRRATSSDALPGSRPEETLNQYFAAMKARNRATDLSIYTQGTRAMLRRWTMTPAQMDNIVRTYRGCHAQTARIGSDGRYAVVRYPVKERACAPWFFQRAGRYWLLDLTMMQKAIRFGRSNAWRFDLGVDHPYRFAFSDWKFDRNGFPRRPR